MVSGIFGKWVTDGRTYGRTDIRTDGPSYRDARTHLKNDQGWLVIDGRWIGGIFEVGLTDGRTYGRTDPLIEMRGRI